MGGIGVLVVNLNLSGVFDTLLLLAFYMLEVALTVGAAELRLGIAAAWDHRRQSPEAEPEVADGLAMLNRREVRISKVGVDRRSA